MAVESELWSAVTSGGKGGGRGGGGEELWSTVAFEARGEKLYSAVAVEAREPELWSTVTGRGGRTTVEFKLLIDNILM